MSERELISWSELHELMDSAELTATDILFIVAKHCSDNVSVRLKHNCAGSAERWFSKLDTLNNYIISEAMGNMTIPQQMEEIVGEMCSQFCKWPHLWDEEAEGMELTESEHCRNCPLNRLT